MFGEWFRVFFKPDTAKEYSKEASVGKATLNILVASVIGGLVLAIFALILGSVVGGFLGKLAGAGIGAALGFGFAVMLFIWVVIGSILSLLIGSAILLLFAKIFGGKGDYTLQTYLISLPMSALVLISGVLGWIPILGGIISFIASIWYLYPLTIVLKQTHKYTTGKAVLTWLIPAIIITIIYAIFAAIFLASFMAVR